MTDTGKEKRVARLSDRMFLRALSAPAMAIGLVFLIIPIYTKHELSQYAQRLDRIGVSTTAEVRNERAGGRGAKDAALIAYQFQGRTYERWIRAGGGSSSSSMSIKVDPNDPTRILAKNGNTDRSDTYWNSWTLAGFGTFIALLGGLVFFRVAAKANGSVPTSSQARK